MHKFWLLMVPSSMVCLNTQTSAANIERGPKNKVCITVNQMGITVCNPFWLFLWLLLLLPLHHLRLLRLISLKKSDE